MKKIPVAIFGRVSKNIQDYNRQIADMQDTAVQSGYEVVSIITEKISGSKKNDEREGVMELLSLAEKKKIKKVLTTEVSRLGRNVSETLKILDRLTELGVSVYVKNLGIETLTSEGKRSVPAGLVFTLMAELARAEKEILVERIKSGQKYSREVKGIKPGRPTGTSITKEDLKKKYSKVILDLRAGISIRKTAKIHGLSPATVLKLKLFI
jgi:DNA invertase Pin-like site-specific DNA recombinase